MKAVCSILIFFIVMSCSHITGNQKESSSSPENHTNSDSLKFAFIEFSETEHNFGRVYEGEQVGWFFNFRNTGSKDLLITNAYSSCGCTVPDYNKKPVRPGEEGMIKVAFDSNGRNGIQTKTVTIESNAKNKIITLNVTAEIIKK